MNKIDRVLYALSTGEQLTTKQIQARFDVANPTAVIHQLRTEGYPIYTNKTKNSEGESKMKYRLGTPSREVVAAGYVALSSMGYQPFN